MKATVLLTLMIAVVGRLIADEAKAWSNWLHNKIRRIAVSKLPAKLRDRYDEEWESALGEIPGDIAKLIYSIGLLSAASGIRNTASKVEGSATRVALPARAFDITFSAMALVVFSPVILAIAIAIKLGSPGPVFYSSERIGKKGVIFRCTKFRTMVLDAEKLRSEIIFMYERDRVLFKVPDDPRITKLGRFLRKYSLDELPLFLNVLKGDMSVVGPRPLIASEVKEQKLNHLYNLDKQPGITGLFDYEHPFVENCSLGDRNSTNFGIRHYIRIILHSVVRTLKGTRL